MWFNIADKVKKEIWQSFRSRGVSYYNYWYVWNIDITNDNEEVMLVARIKWNSIYETSITIDKDIWALARKIEKEVDLNKYLDDYSIQEKWKVVKWKIVDNGWRLGSSSDVDKRRELLDLIAKKFDFTNYSQPR